MVALRAVLWVFGSGALYPGLVAGYSSARGLFGALSVGWLRNARIYSGSSWPALPS